MQVKLLSYPTDQDWLGVKQRAFVTVGKETNEPPTENWKRNMLRAKHSPIRYLRFSFLLELPYWVSVHLCRHIHAQPYVRSQRNDRQHEYDREKAPQDAPVTMIWDMDAEELINIAEKRLCNQAAPATMWAVTQMCDLVKEVCPEFDWVLQAPCQKTGVCNEMFPCGRAPERVLCECDMGENASKICEILNADAKGEVWRPLTDDDIV